MPSKSKEEVVQEYRIQSIQDATMRVIARKGVAAATMQDIAEEAGVAKGTIYLYFRDRDELVEKTFERAITELQLRTAAALDGEGSFESKLRAMLAAKIAFFREHREFFRLYTSLRLPEGNPQQQRRQKRFCQPQYEAHLGRMAEVLREAMERGEVRRTDPRRLSLFITEGSNAIVVERVMEENPPTEQDDVDLLVGAIVDGIAVRSQRK
jgi:AcrR family transcriptional regulator